MTPHRRLLGLGGLLVLVSAAACGDLGPQAGPLADLGRNYERWLRQRPVSYQYGIERLCFCGPEWRGPVRVTVIGDAVVSRLYVTSGDTVPSQTADLFPTVDGLFAVLRDAHDRDAHAIEVTYDPTSGVPLDIWIDYEEFVADEELGFSVTETVAPTAAR